MFTSLTLLVLAGLLGPLLAAGRRPLVPVLVGELLAGAILGRTWLHVIEPTIQPFPVFMTLGFAMLMLEAGNAVDLADPDLRAGALRGGAAFAATLVASLPLGLGIAVLTGSSRAQLFMVLLAGSSAAVAFPTIREHALSGPSVRMLIAWITVADAVTALLMPLTLIGASGVPQALLGDLLIVAVAAGVGWLGRPLFRTWLADEAGRESKYRHWALQLRGAVLLLLVLSAIAEKTGASLLLAGFAAGVVLRRYHEPHRLVHQLTGLATGFFVPAFFVLLGASLDLSGLVREPSTLVLAVALAGSATAGHLLGASVAAPERRVAAGLLASAQLGLPAAAAAIGLAAGTLSSPVATALVAAGVLTLIPASAGAVLLGARGAPPPAPDVQEHPRGPRITARGL